MNTFRGVAVTMYNYNDTKVKRGLENLMEA